MFLRISWPVRSAHAVRSALAPLCGEPREWAHAYGRSLVWICKLEDACELNVVVKFNAVELIGAAKERNGRDQIGFTDAVPYAAPAALAATLHWLLQELGPEARDTQGFDTLVFLPAVRLGADSEALLRKLFVPAGYQVSTERISSETDAAHKSVEFKSLRLEAEKRPLQLLQELSVFLSAFDIRTGAALGLASSPIVGDVSDSVLKDHVHREIVLDRLRGIDRPARGFTSGGSFPRYQSPTAGQSHSFATSESAVCTTLSSQIQLSPEQRRFALSHLHRTVDPRWLMYLPPPVVVVQSTTPGSPLEQPQDAFDYYRNQGIRRAVVEVKHMGSRAMVVVCKDEDAAIERFQSPKLGCVYTRNGRPFFTDHEVQSNFLDNMRAVLTRNKFWERFETSWALFDGELMPWTAKAKGLFSAVRHGLLLPGKAAAMESLAALNEAEAAGLAVSRWKAWVRDRLSALDRTRDVLSHYDADPALVTFAPFHLLATEGRAFTSKSHLWHMETMGKIARAGDGFLTPTAYQTVELGDVDSERRALEWWSEISDAGMEGVVIKPMTFIPRGRRGFCQPALKCRTAEHLRLVYGPEYDFAENLETLRQRDSLLHRRNKHRRVIRQFALGCEALERTARRAPLAEVQECILALLALEKSPEENETP